MSNPTEFGTNNLPDLDREWLALALLKKFWKGYEWAGENGIRRSMLHLLWQGPKTTNNH